MKTDLEYFNEYSIRKKSFISSVKNMSRVYMDMNSNPTIKKIEGSKFLSIIDYSDLNTWDVNLLCGGISKDMDILITKLLYMVNNGHIPNIYPLLNRMVNRGIRKQTKPAWEIYEAEFLGHGHFRFGSHCGVLTDNEIKFIKEYFSL